MRGLVAVLLAAALLGGCRSSDGTNAPRTASQTSVDPSAIVGRWASGTTSSSGFVDLAADGTVSAADGCNSHAGTWEATGPSSATITYTSSSDRRCLRVTKDAWIEKAAALSVLDGEATFTDDDGERIGTLGQG